MSIPSKITFDLTGGDSGKARAQDSGEKASNDVTNVLKEDEKETLCCDSYTLFPVNLILWNGPLFQAISHMEFM